MRHVLAPAAAGLQTLGLGGRHSVSLSNSSLEEHLLARPLTLLWKPPLEARMAAEQMRALGLQTRLRLGLAPARVKKVWVLALRCPCPLAP